MLVPDELMSDYQLEHDNVGKCMRQIRFCRPIAHIWQWVIHDINTCVMYWFVFSYSSNLARKWYFLCIFLCLCVFMTTVVFSVGCFLQYWLSDSLMDCNMVINILRALAIYAVDIWTRLVFLCFIVILLIFVSSAYWHCRGNGLSILRQAIGWIYFMT